MAGSADGRDTAAPDADDGWAGYVAVPLEPPRADDFLPPAGTVAGRLARWPVPAPPEMAGLAFYYDAFVQGLAVPAERLLLDERVAAALGVDREALLREAECAVQMMP